MTPRALPEFAPDLDEPTLWTWQPKVRYVGAVTADGRRVLVRMTREYYDADQTRDAYVVALAEKYTARVGYLDMIAGGLSLLEPDERARLLELQAASEAALERNRSLADEATP